MKNAPLLVLALLFGVVPLRAAESSGYAPESRSSSEIFTSKVVKVYAFEDGGFEYVAYVVTWKNHEVVVTPLILGADVTRYKVGDTVRCQMQQSSLKVGETTRGRMTFSLLPPGRTSIVGADAASERARVEAVAEEVARRRAMREGVGP